MVLGGTEGLSRNFRTEQAELTPQELERTGINGKVLGEGMSLSNFEFDPEGGGIRFMVTQIPSESFNPSHHGDFKVVGDDYNLDAPRHVRIHRLDEEGGGVLVPINGVERRHILRHARHPYMVEETQGGLYNLEAIEAMESQQLFPEFPDKPDEHIRDRLSPFAPHTHDFILRATPRMRRAKQAYLNEDRRITTTESPALALGERFNGLVDGDLYDFREYL